MKNVFKKKNLEFFSRFVEKKASSRDHWTLAREYLTEEGYTYNVPTLILLLTKGAEAGDAWSMCQLARQYAVQSVDGLPLALHWWSKAIAAGDMTAYQDVRREDILSRIHSYSGSSSAYANMEIQCAMLAGWILTQLNLDDWNCLTLGERTRRTETLIREASAVLRIQAPALSVRKDCKYKGRVVDGLAVPEGDLWLREAVLDDLHRLIQVIFHELGHYVTYSMWDGENTDQQERFGVTKERVETWWKPYNRAVEADADTLGYGVYSAWVLFYT